MVVMGKRKDGRFYVKGPSKRLAELRRSLARMREEERKIAARQEAVDSMKKNSILEIDAKIARLRAESKEYPFLVPELQREIDSMKKMRERMID